MAVIDAPILILVIELAGLDLEVCSAETPVLNEEGGHVVVLLELPGGVQDADGNIEVSTLLEAPQALEGPVEYPGALLLDMALDLWVALALR